MSAALALFAFGAVTALLSLQYPVGTLRAPGSGLFPLLLGALLMGLAAVEIFQLRLAKAEREAPAAEGAARRVAGFIGAVALGIALLPLAGDLAVGFLLMLALLWILGVRRWQVCGPVALGTAAASHVVFVWWLKIPLPRGWLFG